MASFVPSRKSQFLLPLYSHSTFIIILTQFKQQQLTKIETFLNFRYSFLTLMASPNSPTQQNSVNSLPNFHDCLPAMAGKLGGEGLIGELCKGFELLMDREKGVITFESLRRNASAVLGLGNLTDEDVRSMINEGDFDCDGALNQMEFCVLMFRLSPDLMDASEYLLTEALEEEFDEFTRRD